ncbi:UDP-glycosyltransferase 89A2-like [Andrographis paniculata]|uniref:UDP-glycosyltransferase 89A2-like n=1 Tax=Andrographis paniculata TaxID=175694 RepID=UPI0021E77F42|nr:UDP-glycosyltransferase 89A2-like [Andrographis paniculata]
MSDHPHILVFPFPAQGHMLPLLDLTDHLSRRGLRITILVTPKNLEILNPLLSSNPSIETLILPFPSNSHPPIPPGVENVREIGNHGNIPIMSALKGLQDPIIQWFRSHHNPPMAILSDFFLGWTHNLAAQMGIPRIVFYSSGALLTAVFDSLWSLPNPKMAVPGTEIKFSDLPRSPAFNWQQLPSLYKRYRALGPSDPSHEVITTLMCGNTSSWASVFNSFHDLENEFLQHLIRKSGHARMYCVGPLNMGGLRAREETYTDKEEVIPWLDQWKNKNKNDDNCVLYVCFGSQKLLKKSQMEALATALDMSHVRFVWAFKPPTAQQLSEGYGTVPEGFKNRVQGRGVVVEGWVPQAAILSHPAVGGFLSHCGWNSVLEAIVAGVMILGWPMEADQFVNAKLLVEYKRAAVVVFEGDEEVPDPAELARKISETMEGGGVERVGVKELRDMAMAATMGGGSSDTDLDRLVQEIEHLKKK